MRVTALGVRGSIPMTLPEMQGVGGATSAVAIARDGEAPSLVLDAGTGLLRWGRTFGGDPFRGSVILGHVHWDHIIGLPFWPQADREGATARVLVPQGELAGPVGNLLRPQGARRGPADPTGTRSAALAALDLIMNPPAFPITADELRGDLTFETYGEGTMEVSGWEVTAREIPHKGSRTMGLRIVGDGGSLAYLSDHAPQVLGPGVDGLGELHEAALALADGVDLLIHDAQYTAAELPTRGGFGHAAVEYAARLGAAAGVGTVALFHHDPVRTDVEVEALAALARGAAPVSVVVAKDGMEFKIPD